MKQLVRYLLPLTLLLLIAPVRAELPEDAVWIDVRSPGEFAEGHLADATLIPFDGIEAGVAGLNLDKDTPIYLYCGSGGRAGVAKQTLERKGYTRVINAGGLSDALDMTGQETPVKP